MPNRPKYLNLVQIRLPLPGVVSIMHRVSGAVLFLALPFLLWWLQKSLTSGRTFAEIQTLFSFWLRQTGLDRLAVGLPAPLVRGHPARGDGPALRVGARERAVGQPTGARRQHRIDRHRRGVAMVNREVVGAHYGLRDWLAQRVTAVVMTVYTVLFVAVLLQEPKFDYSSWRTLFAPQWMKLASLLFLISMYFACVGRACAIFSWITSSTAACAWCCMSLAIAWLSHAPAGRCRFCGAS